MTKEATLQGLQPSVYELEAVYFFLFLKIFKYGLLNWKIEILISKRLAAKCKMPPFFWIVPKTIF